MSQYLRYSLMMLSLFFVLGFVKPDDRYISITANGEVQVPADKIQFNINMNAEGNTPQKAYQKHKEQEKFLVSVLKKHSIKEENINFQPMSISKYRLRNEEEAYRTSQQVILTFTDFELYDEIQLALISNGFDNFNGRFISTEQKKGQDEAIKKAIQNAQDKAQLVASQTDVKLGKVLNVDLSTSSNGVHPMVMRAEMASKSASLFEYDQMVTVTANVHVKFAIE